MSYRQLTLIHCVLLAAITVAAYLDVRHHHFVWDTIPFVLENPWVHEVTIDNIVAMFTQAHRANWQPIVNLSHTFDIYWFGYDSGAHHLVNLAMHTLNALLLYWLVSLLLGKTGKAPTVIGWIAFLTAIIFALHPQHVESVAWVVERKDVLYSLFALGCMIAYLKTDTVFSWRSSWLPFSLFCLSIASKPMAVTLPVILMMLDLYPRRQDLTPAAVLKRFLQKSHYFAVSAIVSLITLNTQSIAMPGIDNLPAWARILNAVDNSWFYIAHYLWPVNLSPFYPYPQNAKYLASAAFWLPGVTFLLISSIAALVCLLRGLRWPGLLLAFYLVTLLPVSGLIHVGPAKATDHYVYLATIPLSLLTALLIVTAWQAAPKIRALIAPLSIAYLLFLLAITQVQVSYWNNPVSLWTRVTSLHPDAAFGHRNLAAAYVSIDEWDLALIHAELSLKLGSPDVSYVERLRNEHTKRANGAKPDDLTP